MMKFNIKIQDMEKPNSILGAEDMENLKAYLATKPKIIILAHANPDGDTFGGALAMYLGLKSIDIPVELACVDDPPEKLRFLSHVQDMMQDFDENAYDAACFVDCGDKRMVRFQESKPRIISDDMVKINIDHHASNDRFGEINFVAEDATSSTEVVYRILQALEIHATPQMATALLLGLYTDTGAFMHQNTTPESYFVASELVKLGGNIAQISKNIFLSYDLKTMRLWGKVLRNLHITGDGAAIVGVEKEDYESIGASRSDLEGVIDFINSLPEAKYAVILSEDEKGNVKASFRTRKPDVDVKALAEKFGGGGHIKAAGFTLPKGHLEKAVRWKIVQDEE